jgi:outer membrane lipoprotein-sorting protein
LQQVNSFYNVEAAKDGGAYRITLTPKAAAVSKVVKWVSLTVDQNLLPSQVEFETARGDKMAIRYSNIHHKSIPDLMFQLTPPPGTKVTQSLGPGSRAF